MFCRLKFVFSIDNSKNLMVMKWKNYVTPRMVEVELLMEQTVLAESGLPGLYPEWEDGENELF